MTPGRKTSVVLGGYRQRVIEPLFSIRREAQEISRLSTANEDVQFFPGIGWRLQSYLTSPELLAETFEGDGAIEDQALYTLNPNLVVKSRNRDPGLTGASYAGPSSSNKVWHKEVDAGGTWDQKLSADQTAFPGPPASYSTAMDRVVVGKSPHVYDDLVRFQFIAPKKAGGSNGLCRFYFSGPARVDSNFTGFGQYCIEVLASGDCVVWERGEKVAGAPIWTKRHSFAVVAVPFSQAESLITIIAGSNSKDDGSGTIIPGDSLFFYSASIPDIEAGKSLSSTLFSATVALAGSMLTPSVSTYRIPGDAATRSPRSAPIRIDGLRGIRYSLQIAKDRFKETGRLVGDAFSLDFVPIQASKIYMEWEGNIPDGCSVTARLLDQSGTELSGRNVTIAYDGIGEQIEYDCPAFNRTFYPDWELTSNTAKTKSPNVKAFVGVRLAKVDTSPIATEGVSDHPIQEDGVAPLTTITDISFTGTGENPMIESGSVTIHDLLGNHEYLAGWGGKPAKIIVSDEESGQDVVLIEGICDQPETIHRGVEKSDDQPFGGKNYAAYRLMIQGEGRRLMRRRVPAMYNFWDAQNGKPEKVTTAARKLLEWAGYEGMIDIPDLPLRIFPNSDGTSSLIATKDASIFDLLMELIVETLGAYLIWDASAGTSGMWRMLQRKPFNAENKFDGILLRFDMRPPLEGRVFQAPESYGNRMEGDQLVQYHGVRAGTYRKTFEPPEANKVAVFGGTDSGRDGAPGVGVELSQVAYNPRGYNFAGLPDTDPRYPDPLHPDYLGEEVSAHRYDASLATQEAVDWVTVRLRDYACFGRFVHQFMSRLPFITDVNDPLQLRPRIPRFYDPVEFVDQNGVVRQCLIVTCDPVLDFTDGFQMAMYTIVESTQGDRAPLPLGLRDIYHVSRKRGERDRQRNGMPKNVPLFNHKNVEIWGGANVRARYPVRAAELIQDLDVESDTFGEMLFIPDLTPVS